MVEYSEIGFGKLPDGLWESCPVFTLLLEAGSGTIDDENNYPEPPDDFYLSLCYSALRKIVYNATIQHNVRIEALAGLFGVAQLEDWERLQSIAELADIVYRCLQQHHQTNFSAFHMSRKMELQMMIKTLAEWKVLFLLLSIFRFIRKIYYFVAYSVAAIIGIGERRGRCHPS